MPVFQAKVRTVESYLAGIGASSALLAGALVLFVVLVGAVTFDSWPRDGGLFAGRGGDVRLNTSAATSQPSARPQGPNLVKLLGRTRPVASQPIAVPTREPSLGNLDHDLGGGNGRPPGRLPQQSPPPSVEQPPSNPPTTTTPPSSPRNVVQQTVSNVGNAVQSDTTAVGDDLGGSDSPVGGVVGGVGTSLNNTLQGVADSL